MNHRQIHLHLVIIAVLSLNLLQVSAMPSIKGRGMVTENLSPAAPRFLRQISTAPLPQQYIPTGEKYEIDVVMDYARHFLTVEETITYPNRTNTNLNSMVIAVPPNLVPNCFDLLRLTVGSNDTTSYTLNRHRLEIPLQTSLEPDSSIQLILRYTLSLPYLDQFNTIHSRVFGYTDSQTNLINWYPFVVPFQDGEWTLHDPWFYGDYLVYPFADYKVNLLFVGKEDAPVVATSGGAERIGAFTRYTLKHGRAFALSISPKFQVSSIKVGDTTVNSYYLPAYRKPAEAAMQTAAQAIELFESEFGSYPRSSFSIVQADMNDSREFSGISFISRNFYQLYNGTSKNYLTYAAIHTAAHQWWFDQVGNDPAIEPWLDEALATYSESLYFETLGPELIPYWQTNRVNFFRPQGKIDSSIYEDYNYETYRQSVYFNGVYFLQDLREHVGDQAFRDFLRDYYRQGRGNIMTSDDFFRILDAHTDVDYSDIVQKYFSNK
jgi:hypothetical protein